MELLIVLFLVYMIQIYGEILVLKICIEKISKKFIEQYKGENGMDVLYYVIIVNNMEVVSFLFYKGIFKLFFEFLFFLYLYLVVRLGYKMILNMLF